MESATVATLTPWPSCRWTTRLPRRRSLARRPTLRGRTWPAGTYNDRVFCSPAWAGVVVSKCVYAYANIAVFTAREAAGACVVVIYFVRTFNFYDRHYKVREACGTADVRCKSCDDSSCVYGQIPMHSRCVLLPPLTTCISTFCVLQFLNLVSGSYRVN